ncbi:hypothetical protein [Rhodohalobacter sp. 8-1]|uniref:hypothetical protein n=1 Tax=Rhodohalobacter sp. 8-1 TaxID=3131972 RepID=UPI0030EC755C
MTLLDLLIHYQLFLKIISFTMRKSITLNHSTTEFFQRLRMWMGRKKTGEVNLLLGRKVLLEVVLIKIQAFDPLGQTRLFMY